MCLLLVADGSHGSLKSLDICRTIANVSKFILDVVALNIDDDTISQLEAVAAESGSEGLLLTDCAMDEFLHLGVFSFQWADSGVEDGDLPITAD